MTALEQWKELARVENLRHQLVAQPTQAIVGRNYGAKVDLMAVAFDAIAVAFACSAALAVAASKVIKSCDSSFFVVAKNDFIYHNSSFFFSCVEYVPHVVAVVRLRRRWF